MRRWSGLVAGALVCVGAPAARADDSVTCGDASARGQELRMQGHWHDAEVQFKRCAGLVCSRAVAQDCVRRYEELDAAMPTLLVSASRPDGTDTVDARLVVDGTRVASGLPATSLEVDPGQHVIAVEHDGWTAPSQTVVALEHQRDRRVAFHFAEVAHPAPPRQTRLLGIALTAGGAVVTGIGAVFVAVGLVQRGTLLGEPCASTMTCSPDEVGAVTRDYVVGGIAAGVGLAALAVGIWELTAAPGHGIRIGAAPGGLRLTF